MSLDAIRAARAYVETFFDDGAAQGIKKLERQLDALGDKARSIGGNLLAISAPILGLGAAAVTHFTAAGSALDDMSQRTGIGVSSLSELSHAAQMSGTSLESLESALVKQTRFLGDLQSGSKGAANTLAQLGLSTDDLAGLSGDQAFLVLADAVSQVDDEVTRTNLAMDVFGKGATELLPMLNAGSAGIEKLRQEARDLGIVMSDEDAAAAAEFGDMIDRLWAQILALTSQVGSALIPTLSKMIDQITPLLTAGIEWISQNDEIVLLFAEVSAGVMAGGAALVGLGFATSAAATGMGYVVSAGSSVIGTVISIGKTVAMLLNPISLISGAWGVLLGGFSTAGAVFAALPTALAIGAIGALAYAFIDFESIFQSVIGTLTSGWNQIVDGLSESLGLAAQLVQNGEITLAMELVWAQIELLWGQGTRWLVEQIGTFVTATVSALAAGIEKLGTLLDKTRNALARQIAAAGEYVGILPEGTSETLNEMQAAGQVGTSSLHDMAKALEASGDSFMHMGENVDELQAKLNALKGQAVEANVRAEIQKTEKAAVDSVKKRGGMQPQLDFTGGALGGTFSGNAGRMLYSQGGESKVVSGLANVEKSVDGVRSAILDTWGRVGA